MPTLVIGNKCYSSWSLRPWLLLREFGLSFDEVLIPFTDPIDTPEWKGEVRRYSPAGRVPAFVDGEVRAWDSLAIIDTVADLHPDLPVWPQAPAARAMARSVSAEMHSGFQGLRGACPMNLGKRFGPRDRGERVARDVARIVEIWTGARERFGDGGPFLFGAFSAADAMYAPVVTRLDTYAIEVPSAARAYMDAILALSSFQAWRQAALAEPWLVPEDEVDEEPVDVLRTAATAVNAPQPR